MQLIFCRWKICVPRKRWIQNDSTIINIGFKHLHGHLQVEHPAYVTAYGAPRQGALCADAEHSAGSGRAQHCRVHGFSVMPIITKSATAKCLTFKNHQKPAILSNPFLHGTQMWRPLWPVVDWSIGICRPVWDSGSLGWSLDLSGWGTIISHDLKFDITWVKHGKTINHPQFHHK